MKVLTTGQFHGQTNKIHTLDGITLTDTEYTQAKVDWHYHENAYFTFILQGQVLEGNKKKFIPAHPAACCFTIGKSRIIILSQRGIQEAFILKLKTMV